MSSIQNQLTADETHLRRAIALAREAEALGNLPVGAVITRNKTVVSEGRNAIWRPSIDLTRHAEMEALRGLSDEVIHSGDFLTLYTTLEPCTMCTGAIFLHGIDRVVFGSIDPLGGTSEMLNYLPPYMKSRRSVISWEGPSLNSACDPLFERLVELIEA